VEAGVVAAVSMICTLRQVSDERIAQLVSDPDEVVHFLFGPAQTPKPGLWSRWFGSGGTASAVPEQPWDPRGDDELLDLDRAWHGIHYLLTFSDWGGRGPLGYLVVGGKSIGRVDVGYGPARALRSGQVRRFRDALASIGPDVLAARYDSAEMTDRAIYPNIWDAVEQPDPLGYLQTHYGSLRAFLDQTVDRAAGLLVYLS